MVWSLFYKQIRAANALLTTIPADAENAELKAYRGQALAFRAYNYWNLAQLWQFTYKGNETRPCVPIITEETTSGDNPRNTVQEVYTQIETDLTTAIGLLEGYTQPTKGYIDEAVAYGLRARAYLVMQKYAEAAADADKALTLSKATPYTLADVRNPTFYSATHKSVMWANLITPENDVVTSGIINWPSHLCSFSGNGYVSVGAVRSISKLLYAQISATDVRKGWWLDDNNQSPLVEGTAYDVWREEMESYIEPRLNVKFGAYEGKPMNPTNASDWTLMRAEEMILIKAEGLAKSGNDAAGRQVLEDFVKTNRDPSYTAGGDVQEAVWLQRRIELWGEGFSFFDIMRLQKPITRVGAGYAAQVTFNIEANAPILLWRIPQSETETNHAITHPADNNPTVPAPTPVTE
jgi:tetratricopeptide (TPR) repeat protein